MATKTLVRAEDVEKFMTGVDLPRFSVSRDGARWVASTYWPNGDVVRDKGCYGHAATLAEAVTDMLAAVEKAKLEVKKLKTAAECKAAVIDLIRQHDAAPASFRDAVDALPVSDR